MGVGVVADVDDSSRDVPLPCAGLLAHRSSFGVRWLDIEWGGRWRRGWEEGDVGRGLVEKRAMMIICSEFGVGLYKKLC